MRVHQAKFRLITARAVTFSRVSIKNDRHVLEDRYWGNLCSKTSTQVSRANHAHQRPGARQKSLIPPQYHLSQHQMAIRSDLPLWRMSSLPRFQLPPSCIKNFGYLSLNNSIYIHLTILINRMTKNITAAMEAALQTSTYQRRRLPGKLFLPSVNFGPLSLST